MPGQVLENSLAEQTRALEDCQGQVQALEAEKKQLQRDMDKIMGNLSRW